MTEAPANDALMWKVFNQFHYLCDTHRYQKMLARADVVRRLVNVPGDIVDCGTFKGISTLQFAHFLQIYRPHGAGRVVSFDTFEARFPRVRADEVASAADHMDRLYEETAYDQLQPFRLILPATPAFASAFCTAIWTSTRRRRPF